jgi:hypothetical protein
MHDGYSRGPRVHRRPGFVVDARSSHWVLTPYTNRVLWNQRPSIIGLSWSLAPWRVSEAFTITILHSNITTSRTYNAYSQLNAQWL